MQDYPTNATAGMTLRPTPAWLPDNEIDHAFINMLDSYRSSGGLARAKEVFNLFKNRSDLGVAALASSIARRGVLSLQWHCELWMPLFQFERQGMTIKPTLEPVFKALNPVFSPWGLAHWCSQPNRWLDGESPADTLDADAARVLRAACADRFALM
jgi:hypothetical protein